MLQRGAGMVFHGADIVMVKAGLERVRKDFAGLGFRLDPDP